MPIQQHAAPSGQMTKQEEQTWLDIVEHCLTELFIKLRPPAKPRVARTVSHAFGMSALNHAFGVYSKIAKKGTEIVESVTRTELGVELVLVEASRSIMKNKRCRGGPCPCGPCHRAAEDDRERKRLREEQRAAYAKRGVPKDVKAQIADFARAGEDLATIGDLFGYDAASVWKIARSAGVKLVRPGPAMPESGLVAGLDAKVELEIAGMLETGVDAAFVATRFGVSADVVTAVAGAWASPEKTDEQDVDWNYVPWAPTDAVHHAVSDPTRAGEILFLDGGQTGWRVEFAPLSAGALEDAFDALRRQTIKGSRKTEFDVLKESIRRFAAGEIGFGQNDRRFKSFAYGGVTLHEFKGWQARAFCAVTTSRYSNGETVRRCGLLTCFVKKDDDTPDSESNRAVTAREAWLAWRQERDEVISESMRGRAVAS